MDRKKVAILFGGVSSEHEVSRVSAAAVARAVPRDRYDALLIGITKDGRWFAFSGSPDEMEDGSWERSDTLVPAAISPDRSVHGALLFENGGVRTVRLDAVFPVLHGKNGEDGTIQGLLEIAGIPYVGCPVRASAVCMDKAVTNLLLERFGIDHAAWRLVRKDDGAPFDELEGELKKNLGYPMFVKPANAGSSVGITKAHDAGELEGALALAFLHDDKVIVERTIVGKELECAVLGNRELTASAVGEILPANEFYDYEAKYSSADSKTLIPADITPEQSDEIRRAAVRAFSALDCRGLARVDFLLEQSTGKIYLNELNTIPGFTSISMYAKMLAHSGLEFPELVSRLIELGIERTA